MKVTVSIPDSVYAEAETLVKRYGTPRSALYSRALKAFIGRHAPNKVTDAMNAVVDEVTSEPHSFSAEAARHVFTMTDW